MIQNIIVLGGGSAGFMAALALKTKLPALRVRVIRSRDIGVIGVGEGSTGTLTHFLHEYLKVGFQKFYEQAQPTWKLGLRFLWGTRPYFNYTFGPGLETRSDATQEKPNGYYCDQDIEYTDFISALMTEDRVFARHDGLPVAHPHMAYHFENEKFVAYLENAARAVRIEIIDDTVARVERDGGNNVTALTMQSGRTERADLYVDCSGFASVLLSKTLNEPFESYASSLFCERAIIGGWNRGDSQNPADQVIRPYTTCETMNSGWAWQIEHEHRINRGYVYCPHFISDADAEAEFRRISPLVGSTRVVRFTSGRYARAWVGNVVGIGNASGFVEPLEATALGVIARQSMMLADLLVAGDRQPRATQIALYNRANGMFWDSIRGFLALHYKFNRRLDTPFWRHCWEHTDLADAAPIVEYFHENGPDGYWGPTLLGNPLDQFSIGGYHTMLVGMGVPFARTWSASEAERAKMDHRRRAHRDAALKAMSVREALAAIRSPAWSWKQGDVPAGR